MISLYVYIHSYYQQVLRAKQMHNIFSIFKPYSVQIIPFITVVYMYIHMNK